MMIIVFDTVSKKERRPDSQAGGKNTKQGQNQVNWKAVKRNPVPHNPEAIKALVNAMVSRKISDTPLMYRGYARMWCHIWRELIVDAINGNYVARDMIQTNHESWRQLCHMLGMNGSYIRKIILDYYGIKG
jgi:hypothetical protein